MKTMRLYFSCVFYLFILGNLWGQTHYLAENGRMHFKSDAPLELIEATSAELKGVLDTEKGSFAFSVDIPTFQGFNSPLQREHFNENYLESKRYPRATFVGKIIEEVDFFAPGSYEVRAKGVLDIHGVKQERIIKGQLNVTKDGISIRADFTVLLEDHKISIPRIVHQKIAEEIMVDMAIFLQPKPAE